MPLTRPMCSPLSGFSFCTCGSYLFCHVFWKMIFICVFYLFCMFWKWFLFLCVFYGFRVCVFYFILHVFGNDFYFCVLLVLHVFENDFFFFLGMFACFWKWFLFLCSTCFVCFGKWFLFVCSACLHVLKNDFCFCVMHINCPTPISNPHPVSKDNKNILPPNNIDFSFEQLQHYFLFNIKKTWSNLATKSSSFV